MSPGKSQRRPSYGSYRNASDEVEWRILAGADEQGNPQSDAMTYAVVDGSSIGQDIQLAADVVIGAVDPQDPSTAIETVQALVVHLGPSTERVPLTPDVDRAFFIPNGSP